MKHRGITDGPYEHRHPQPHYTRTVCGQVVLTMELFAPEVTTCHQCLPPCLDCGFRYCQCYPVDC
jgi:hypothetical protein